MAYRGSEAYDFSLFEPQVIEQPKQAPRRDAGRGSSVKRASSHNAAPKKAAPAQNRPAPQRRPAQKKSGGIHIADNYQYTIERKTSTAAVPAAVKKAMVFACFCFAMLTVLLVMQTKSDMLMTEISSVQSDIEIAEGERVRLNAELSSMISSDKIENYAENVLGMVKAESYQVSYVDLSEGDEIVFSGDKSVDETGDLSSKLKSLFAYLD